MRGWVWYLELSREPSTGGSSRRFWGGPTWRRGSYQGTPKTKNSTDLVHYFFGIGQNSLSKKNNFKKNSKKSWVLRGGQMPIWPPLPGLWGGGYGHIGPPPGSASGTKARSATNEVPNCRSPERALLIRHHIIGVRLLTSTRRAKLPK